MLETVPSEHSVDWKTVDELVPGYPRLAGEMQNIPELAIFRRFGALNARNLLYLQHDLKNLEDRLKLFEYFDSVSGSGERPMYSKDSQKLRESALNGDSKQWELVLEIRKKLKEYNKTLIQQHILHNIKEPGKWDSADIMKFIFSPGCMNDPFTGSEKYIWGRPNDPRHEAGDLIALRSRLKEDKFSHFVATYAIHPLDWMVGRDKKGTVLYSNKSVLKITYWMNGVIASLVPILCIWVLQSIDTLGGRIGAIAAFNLLIAACMQTFTDAKRPEVFAVVAAFTAVQVVFVGQALDDIKEVRPADNAVFNTTCSC
ncbi:unnamed protein product [Periconia digitata]|uniref:DUF6594 domain-containing protein n=1 Tax=Periconia digitata TaxID=1303443 RepID=A0A9W4U264_9PLEO|nr:unnamed protein product [Periconia digitata]